jgi:DNA-binding NarL/FixJ family response regulator
VERRVRILIVDDCRIVRRGLRAMLALCPEAELVGEAADHLEAIQLAVERSPDVVLMDMQMSVIDGLQAARCIKEKLPDVRIVALTLYDQCEAATMAAGVDDFWVKGDSADNLLDTLLKNAKSPHPEPG